MKTQLLPHNKKAYAKVTEALKNSQRTCVIHPTGTGKSYLMAAVSEKYKKVLVLGPNIYVLNQVHNVLEWRKKGIQYMTYAALMNADIKPTGFDLICLDEFHRVGAPEWGTAVNELLEVNPQAKVLGTTATNIRYLDEERDMAQEIFSGNVASYISIAEAWAESILPIPKYVSGLFRWDKTIDDAKERINKTHSLTDKEKRERIFRLTNAHLHWELSYGMPAILKKHLDKDTRRIIVFCGGIEQIDQMKKEVVGWFHEAGLMIASTCIMHSDLTESEQKKQMQCFEDDTDGEGIKLMFSVNMLNEGIHIPNVNAVLMLRTTFSRIIYMQQMGRCLTAANTDRPLVLDMVDNITTTTIINKIVAEFDNIEREKAEKESRNPRKFEVIDYTLGVKELVNKLIPEELCYISDEERLTMITKFCKEYGRFPNRNKEKDLFKHYAILRRRLKGDPRLEELDDLYSEYKNFDKRLAKLIDFVEHNGRTPKESEKDDYNNYKTLLRKNKKVGSPVVAEIICKYAPRVNSVEYVKVMVLDFYEKNGHMPMKNSSDFKERSLYNKYATKRKFFVQDEDIKRIIKKRREMPLNKKIAIVREFIAKNGRRPATKDGDTFLVWKNMLSCGKNNPEVQKMIEDTNSLYKQMGAYIAPLVEFVNQEHRAPDSRENRHLYNILAHVRNKYSDHPDVAALLAKIDKYKQQKQEAYINNSIDKIEAYVAKNGSLPSVANAEKRWCRDLFNCLRRKYYNHPRVAEMVKKYTNNK